MPVEFTGLVLAGPAVIAAGQTDLDAPDRLVVRGPYEHSRKPMYVAWMLVYFVTPSSSTPPGRWCSYPRWPR